MSTLKTKGVSLYYTEKGQGKPILFIHGTGMNADMWGSVFEVLAAHYRVIAYDRRGHSRSKHSPVKDYHLHAEDAANLLTDLSASPAVLVGWSAGGIIALDVAINHPELVAALVLYEPPLHAKKHPDFSLVKTLLKVTFQRSIKKAEQAAETFLRYALTSTAGGSAYDRWPETWRQAMHSNTQATLAELDAGTGEDLLPAQIKALSCPVTCLWGELSQPFLVKATKRLLTLLPQATREKVPDAAHAIHLDQPGRFVEIIERAVKS